MFNNKIHSIIIGCAAVAALSTPATASAVFISRPTLGPVASIPPPAQPGAYPLQASAQAVNVRWYDRSTTEQKFVVYKRGLNGAWEVIDQVPTRSMAGESGNYSYLDTDHSVSGQCYMMAAVAESSGAGYTQEECTVRPDPSRFPQTDPASTEKWWGLNNANDGTGELYNSAEGLGGNLTNENQTFGVDLDWSYNAGLWKIEAQGGPQVMRGQAVALRVWGGGWLKYGNETYGISLVLSDTPSYEWYVLGSTPPGSKISWERFALWNSAAKDYLVAGHRSIGASLDWQKETQSSPPPTTQPPSGVKTFVAYNCILEERPLEMWVLDLTAGGGWNDLGQLDSNYANGGCPLTGLPFTFTPKSGHKYEVRSVDYQASGCPNDPNDEAECLRSKTTFVGDANGQVKSTKIEP
jgi:hypothetical protein